ncbi:MAG: ABC transporter permease [Candidatus Aminicenantes bacterium]|nr:ABC transporter permease [Candidatus Aminicenantes bacterium]
MGFEGFVARRYLTARRKQAFVSVITFISALGITIGVAALIIAVALITGFQEDVQAKILSATSHLMVSDVSGGSLADHAAMAETIRGLDGVVSVSPVALNMVLLVGPLKTQPAMMKGMDLRLERTQSPWLAKLESGTLPEEGGRDGILLGHDLAYAMGAGIGDVIRVLSSSSRMGPIGAVPKIKSFKVSGIFATGLYEFDSGTAIIPLAVAQKWFDMVGGVSYLQVMIRDVFAAPAFKETLKAKLPPLVYVTTWAELNKSLFSALKLEKTIIFLTIALIVIVAALNIIATLILMVMEKTRDIGILMSLGATPRHIQRVFFLQGSMIGVSGTILGTVLGLGWCLLANALKLIRVPVDIYQISYVPFHIKPWDLALILGVALAVSLLSTLFPSRRAAKVDPVVALKYE